MPEATNEHGVPLHACNGYRHDEHYWAWVASWCGDGSGVRPFPPAPPVRWRTIGMGLNIDGFVRNNRYPHGWDIFQTDDGTPMTPAEARTFLAIEKAKGHHVIPASAECGNPCKHASAGCTGFDYGERGGCPGRFTTP